MEVWRDIPGYEGLYQASNMGQIRSLPRNTTAGRVMKPHINSRNGYAYVCLCKENKAVNKRVHGLIAKTFMSAHKPGEVLNHKDGDKTNNSVENLEYCTQSENMKHAYAIGLEKPKGLPVIDLDSLEIYETATAAARSLSNGTATGEMVARVCRGEKSHYRGRRFAFLTDYQNDTIPKYKGKTARKASVSLWR